MIVIKNMSPGTLVEMKEMYEFACQGSLLISATQLPQKYQWAYTYLRNRTIPVKVEWYIKNPKLTHQYLNISRYIGPKTTLNVYNTYDNLPTRTDSDLPAGHYTSDINGFDGSYNFLNKITFTTNTADYNGYKYATINRPNIYIDILSLTAAAQYQSVVTQRENGDAYTSKSLLLQDIIHTKLPIRYKFELLKEPIPDVNPYVVTSHSSSMRLRCHATHTLVRHNRLQLEGYPLWDTNFNESGGVEGHRISRTAVDTGIMYKFPGSIHEGPSGIGGYAWVSSRKYGKVYKCSLNNGALIDTYTHYWDGASKSGVGVAVNVDTHHAFVGGYGSNNRITELWHNIPGSKIMYTSAPMCYGLVFGNKQSEVGSLVSSELNETRYLFDSNRKSNIARFTCNNSTLTNVTYTPNRDDPYGVACGKDNTVWYTSYFQNKVYCVFTPVTNIAATPIEVQSGTGKQTRGITVDYHDIYPNTGTQYGVFAVAVGDDSTVGKLNAFKFNIPSSDRSGLNPNNNITNKSSVNAPFNMHPYGIGVDINNSLWLAGSRPESSQEHTGKEMLVKVYQCDNSTTFPYGGNCRYPTSTLDEWDRISVTNTPEIEWFLTRNNGMWDQSTTMSTAARTAYNALIKCYGCVTGTYDMQGPQSKATSLKICFAMNDDAYPTITQQIAAIRNWYETYGSSASNLQGRLLYPHFNADYNKNVVPSTTITILGRTSVCRDFTLPIQGLASTSYMYSDFTGNLISTRRTIITDSIVYASPRVTSPVPSLIATNVQQSTKLREISGYLWNTPTISGQKYVSGYDDLYVTYEASFTNSSFVITGWRFNIYDYYSDYGSLFINATSVNQNLNDLLYYRPPTVNGRDGSLITGRPYLTSYSNVHGFNDPSMIGASALSSIRSDPRSPAYDLNGTFNITFTGYTNINPYTNKVYTLTIAPLTSIVYERWPEAGMLLDMHDTVQARYNWLDTGSGGCGLSWNSIDRATKDNGYTGGKNSNNTIVYNTDPLSATFYDTSRARTYPISSWTFYISTNNIWSSEVTGWTPVVDTLWNYTTSIQVTTNDPTLLPADTINNASLGNYILLDTRVWRYGTWGITLYVEASNTGTQNLDISGNITSFTQYLSVNEFEPFANFWATSALTVVSSYQDDSTTSLQLSDLVDGYIGNNIVSGYAPNLTVYFINSSESHTFPISSYHWDFGDHYNEYNSTAIWNTTSHSGNFDAGCWSINGVSSNVQDITSAYAPIMHTYVMPGIYDVTLTVKASNTETSDICSRYIETTNFYVYVKEIPQQCCYEVSSVSGTGDISLTGTSPWTINFIPSCISAGSFPIGKLSWNFGDGTPIESYTRVPASTASDIGTELIYTSSFSTDIVDVRNWAIPHVYQLTSYDTQISATYNITLSTYAANTNTLIACTSQDVIIWSEVVPRPDDRKHLIGSRFLNDTDIIYELEGVNSNTTYTVVLSGGAI